MKKGHFQSLQEKVWKRILLWGENHLSSGGKEVLIKAVLQTIPVYVMGIFKIPDAVCDELTKAIRNLGSSWGQKKDALEILEFHNQVEAKRGSGLS